MKKTLLLAGVASVFALNTQALEFTPYVGADYNMNLLHKPSYADGYFPGKYHSGSVVMGAKVTPYFAAEIFGELSKHENKKGFHTSYGAYGVDLFGILPLGCYSEWEVLGTAGMGHYVFKEKAKNGNALPYDETATHDSEHEWGYRLGAGVQYNMTENWGVRAMYRRVILHNTDIPMTGMDVISLGVRYSF